MSRTTRTIVAALGAAGLLAAVAPPVSASFNHERIMEMRGGYTVVTHDVGNQSFPVQYVPGEARGVEPGRGLAVLLAAARCDDRRAERVDLQIGTGDRFAGLRDHGRGIRDGR
jgi:hypothetical protein